MLFHWSQSPDARWVAELAALSPPSDQLSHLELWWEAGFPWAPVQRWVLYQLQPLQAMPPYAAVDWRELVSDERPCRCSYVWSAGAQCTECLQVWPCEHSQSPDAIRCTHCKRVRSQGRHNLAEACARGYHAQPFWVIQGAQGGHKVHYSSVETQVATELGLHGRPPEPGSLPYAEWDRRVRANIISYDLSQSRLTSLRRARQQDRALLERQVRVAQEQYLTGVFDRVREETPDRILDEIPRAAHGTRGVDEIEASARYIETGRLSPQQ